MPSKAELEEIKLGLEIDKFRRDLTLMGRLGSLVSLTTAVVAVGGILISVYTLHRQGVLQAQQGVRQAEETDIKLLQEALSMATDGKAQSDRRISGIYQFGPF